MLEILIAVAILVSLILYALTGSEFGEWSSCWPVSGWNYPSITRIGCPSNHASMFSTV